MATNDGKTFYESHQIYLPAHRVQANLCQQLYRVSAIDPTKLIQAAFKVAGAKIKEATQEFNTLQKLQKDPRIKIILNQNWKSFRIWGIFLGESNKN